jgi:ATP-binding cassette subfamily B protein
VERLKRFWLNYAHRYRWVYAVGVVCLIVTNALTVAIPWLVQETIDALDVGEGQEGATVWVVAILFAGLAIMVVRTLSRTLFFNPGRTVEFRLKNDMFGHLLKLPQAYYDRIRPGEIISRGTNDATSVRALIGYGTLQLFNVGLVLVLTITQMLRTNAELTLVCILPLVIAAIVLRYAIRAMFKLVRRAQSQIAVLSDRVLESYNGVSVIRSYNAFDGVSARFDEANNEVLDIGLGLVRISAWLLPVVAVVGHICLVVLLFVGGPMVIDDDLSIGELAAFAVYINILVVVLTSMGWLINSVQRGWISLGRVSEILEAPIERAAGDAPVPAATSGGLPLAVSNLSFAYGDGPTVIDGVDFQVASGETIGIFGPTGSGKTTLLNLIARVYEPPENAIQVSGRDVLEYSVKDYWKRIALVPQEAFLFSRSISDNIALATGAADGSLEDVARAARDAQLSEDLEVLPKGLDTRVGERGITLSGGQRQRTALARAFYRNFDLLLLDDVLSAVDHATEERLIKAIYERAQGATMVVVSHRVSVLQKADRILVIDKGKVVASGTHEELLQERSIYRDSWRLQQADTGEGGDG